MKKALLPLVLVAALALTACGEDKTEQPKAEGFTGKEVVELAGDKGTTFAEVTFENGNPVDVNIDVKEEDGKLKSEISAAGEYVMKEGEEKHWHEQVDALEAYIKENNFDLSKVNLTDEAGHTDAVSGVSIKVGEYVDLVQQALDKVNK